MTLLLRLLFRNALRHRLRAALTIAGVTIAVLSFGILRTVADAWYAGVEASNANRLLTRNAISLVYTLPVSYVERIRQVSGVEAVSHGTFFGGIYIDEKNFFPNFAFEPKTYLDLAPELVLPPAEKEAFIKDRKGVMVGRKTAERFGWKAGDTVTLRGTVYPGNWDFVIKGIYKGRDETVDETFFVFHWDYLNETLRKTDPTRADQAGFFFIRVKDPAQAAQVSLAIDALFKNSLAETLTETEKAFQMSFVSMTEAIMLAIQLISLIVILIIMAVSANTMTMSVRERFNEFAVMKTMGFKGRHMAILIFGEAFAITGAGCAVGVLLTYPAARLFSYELGAYFPVFIVKPLTIWLDVVASAVVAAASAAIPLYRVSTINIVSALRRVA